MSKLIGLGMIVLGFCLAFTGMFEVYACIGALTLIVCGFILAS